MENQKTLWKVPPLHHPWEPDRRWLRTWLLNDFDGKYGDFTSTDGDFDGIYC